MSKKDQIEIKDLNKATPTNEDWLVFQQSEEPHKVYKSKKSEVKGDAATVDVGQTTTLPAGSQAKVTNVGTTSAAVFKFEIPKGDKGDDGAKIVTAEFVGNDIHFNLDDGTEAILVGAKTDLKGATGDTGASVVDAEVSGDDIVFTKSDGSTITIENILIELKGETGNGIATIEKTDTTGLVDTYTITYDDETTKDFTVTNGAKGDTGDNATVDAGTTTTGEAGTEASVVNSGTTSDAIFDFTIPKGDKGDTGNGIASITKTGTSGLTDTYTITFTDETTTTFDVVNGEKGDNAYIYIAYASDDSGADFTTTFNSALDYIAVLSTYTEIPTPQASDFAGLWKKYKGEKGDTGERGLNWINEEYSGATTYDVDDALFYNGSSYRCILESTGNLPTDTTYWALIAQKGLDGEGAGDMLASVYDPTNVADDAFDMDNMKQGDTNLFVTSTEKTEWSGKQDALTNPVTGTGTTNYIPKFTATSGIGDSIIYDDGTKVGIGTTTPTFQLEVARTTAALNSISSIGRFTHISTGDMVDGFGGGFIFGIKDTAGVVNNVGRVGAIRDGADNEGALFFSAGTDGIEEFMRVTSTGNVGIGTTTPSQKLDVSGNININTNGTNALISTYKGADSDGYNIFIGGGGQSSIGEVGATHKGSSNTANGYQALYHNTTGYYNTANGYRALYSNTTGYYNTANGFRALSSNTTGTSNTANGMYSLSSNTTGYNNTANGMYSLSSNTTGYQNTANGFQALYYNTTGVANSALGYRAGRYISDGTTGRETGNYGLYLGYNTKASADGTSNEIVIGYDATGQGSNTIQLGNSSILRTYAKGLNLGAGTATAGTAPLKFTSGVVNTTPEAGAIEFDGTDLFITI